MARIMNYGSSYTDWKPRKSSSASQQPEPPIYGTQIDPQKRKEEVMDKEKVWATDPVEGFVLGRIVDLSEEGAVVQAVHEPSRQPIVTSFDRLYPAEENEKKEVDDNCGLMYLNEATLLNNIRLRYFKDKIYTYVANILIAINPYSDIKDLYASKTIKAYQGRSLGTMPPHVFAIADKAFRDMKVLKQCQSIIVSGESGAGKTESTKYILKYLCDNFGTAGQSNGSGLENKILNANPILEAFGNAKTTRNNNSSRFGKFIEIHFDGRCQVAGGYISHYLLERARVVSQNTGERNYHIFYQLCAGAPDELRKKLFLTNPDHFRYLSGGCTRYFSLSSQLDSKISVDRKSSDMRQHGALRDPMLDDAQDFKTVDQDLKNLGMDEKERTYVYTTIASVLHLGNVAFEDDPDDNRGGCRITNDSENSLQVTSSLIGLDADELRRALTARVMQATKGGFKGTVIMVPLKVHEASNARDALAKSIYSRLFDYIVSRINQGIPFEKSSYYIGVLDIAGFEYFTVNSFEQFCINYCNEKLQQFFNQRILKDEQVLYEKEGLGVKKISFVDNQDCIDLIESKGSGGIFALLDEESKLPKPSYCHFTAAVHSNNSAHFRLALPRKSKLREHREIRDDDGFIIRHFAGAVCYQTQQFIEKNNDALHASLEALAQECKQPFIRSLFVNSQKEGKVQRGKLTFISVGNKFKTQLEQLMDKLRGTGTNFIRCIKPNVKMVAHQFEGGSILSQLQCAGMTSVLELMQQGYPSRTQFSELYNMYKKYLPPELAKLDPRLFSKALFKALGLDDNDFKFGLTKVFFRPGKFAEFDQLMKADPENLKRLVAKVKKWILASQWKKAMWCALSVIKLKNKILYRRAALIKIQANVRMYLARKQHAPRYKGVARLRKLQSQIEEIGKMSSKLKSGKDGVQANVKHIHAQLDGAIAKIKGSPRIRSTDIDRLNKGLVDLINKEVGNVKDNLQKQKVAEEQERIRKIQEEMEKERKRKVDEEQQKIQMEEDRKLKTEMEVKRKKEEELNLIDQLKKDREEASRLQDSLNEENKRLREQIEQERRDHELALRLAAETNSVVMEDSITPSPTPNSQQLKRSSMVQAQAQARATKKYDLSKWKYAELRDTINTSCDIELLESCREEFHRRLKVYHAWKAKNKKKHSGSNNSSMTVNGNDDIANQNGLQLTFDENMRAPSSILVEAMKNQPNDGVQGQSSINGGEALSKRSMGDGVATNGMNTTERYFRIPFVRPVASNTPGENGNSTPNSITSPSKQAQKGWWYAHFDGDWIGRQMELHPERKPVLLVAGVDDMEMCELALHETGLTRKRGAEILDHEFEKEWIKNGGQPYIRPNRVGK